ncbi:dTMP kinase [Georgenia satyanarayanai]|uniref:dTMP kinase n=1 Tax=Georgenia satyanarayanai TaxID=860221 RepID=UPI00203F38E0|nr:dTMP kinase [Georgenia satyanarayanai]MCM3662559.1 dTMP kinase [Georgenia satyanarayanai]
MRTHATPLFIALEGGDGSGKTTQARLLREWLEGRDREVVLTREPGGTDLGRTLRREVLHGEELDPRTEALLYAADRAHHVHTLVRPALARGAVVVTDRYIDSSVAYQGAGRRLGREEIRELSTWATGGLLPDLTVVLDLDAATAAARRSGEPDRLEREPHAFHEEVRAGFLALAGAEPARYAVVDASLPPQDVHRAVVAGLSPLLGADR